MKSGTQHDGKAIAGWWRCIAAIVLAQCALMQAQLVLAQAPSAAQTYPSKAVRVVIGVAPGGLMDVLARSVTQDLAKVWNQPVIVENRAGASDIIAAETVARSAPDGYTIFMANSVTWLSNQFLRRNLPFDPVKDFTPVIGIAQSSDVLIAGNALPANNVQELVALARARPGTLNYGSFGVGTATHLDAIALAAAAGIRITHIPYKGGADVIAAVLGGQVDFAFTGLNAVIPLVRQGKMKALAYGGRQRYPALPQVPTLRESGYGFETGGWFAWFVPSATPRSVVDRIAAGASSVLSVPAFREKYLLAAGMEEMNLQGAALAERVKESQESFASRVKGLDIKLD
jgi:tripartite-type tricarboxylate transporter receptor subunit TctC